MTPLINSVSVKFCHFINCMYLIKMDGKIDKILISSNIKIQPLINGINGLPKGFQLIAPPLEEKILFKSALAYKKKRDHGILKKIILANNIFKKIIKIKNKYTIKNFISYDFNF